MIVRITFALLVAAVVASGAAGCGSAHRTAARSATPPPPQPSVRCGSPNQSATTLHFSTPDGVSLDGALVGSGPIGVVLLHEYPGPMCGWWPYAAYLAHHGVQALLFDFRCLGLSACPRGASAHPVDDVAGAMSVLRAHGARSIAVVGASYGGAVAVLAGAQLRPAAVVDLSGERDLNGLVPGADVNSVAAAADLTAPALFAVARDDRYVSVADMTAAYRRASSPQKRLLVLPAVAGHGWDMLTGSGAKFSPLATRILTFITAHTHTPTPLRTSIDGCVAPAADAHAVTLRPRDEAALPGVLLGTGGTTFVLSNESDENLCGWLPFVHTLERHGDSALLYDARDPSQIPAEAAAAARAARAAGARRLILTGASVGARGSLIAAAKPPPGVAAVISLSAERTIRSDPSDLVRRIRGVRIPTLLISARDDPFVGGATATLAGALATTHKRVLIVPGVDHGTSLLTGAAAPRVLSSILAFVR